MDLQFVSKLQTALQNLGRKNGFAPPESQDPADKILHEYFIAETGRSLFDKRKKIALENLRALDQKGIIAETVLTTQRSEIGGSVQLFEAEHYNCTLSTKAPSATLDKAKLKVELVKLGVKPDIIDQAIQLATTKNKPAETYNVSPRRT